MESQLLEQTVKKTGVDSHHGRRRPVTLTELEGHLPSSSGDVLGVSRNTGEAHPVKCIICGILWAANSDLGRLDVVHLLLIAVWDTTYPQGIENGDIHDFLST